MKRSLEEEDEPDEEMEAETEVVDLDDKTKSRGWWVVVHDADEDPSLLVKTHGYLVGVNWNKEITVSLKLYITRSTRKRRCEGDPKYSLTGCQMKCFAASFVEKRGCRLPFMHVDAPYCRGGAEKTLKEMVIMGGWRQTQCQCPPPCVHALYNYRGDTNDDRLDGRGRIKVFFLDLMYEQVTENLSYPFPSLVADFGGLTGLLLGASLLTLLELLECLVVGLARLYRRQRKRRQVNQLNQTHQRLIGSLYGVSRDEKLPGTVYVVPSGHVKVTESFHR
ncbi:acid-sensing ion channel 3-like [Eriocheir sinensis]|uniref:acid-sensing ion channel 3-like n=1 Tax=Eriocheir sinensis TaxID=95602 RepID=UPI0021C9AC0D|nr:acid-sensing ion channel 3-like [Eriocheir sinensis]